MSGNNIKLLDCTLRDGGSLNAWTFGQKTIINILQSLNDSNIEIVEAGFLKNSIADSFDKTVSSDIRHFDFFLQKIKNRHFKAVAMVDTGKYETASLKNRRETLTDGIRLMFKKTDLNKAIHCAYKIKELGYELSLNPVSVTTYTKEDIKTLIKYANEINPRIIYIVDTYGLMNGYETAEYFKIFNNGLNRNIMIGYHPHNNLQLAFSNSIEIIKNARNRNLVLDGSLCGMGKRAGNTNIELLAQYLNTNCGKKYNIDNLSDIIETEIIPLHKKYEWGYSYLHFLAAINKCHSDYAAYLKNEKNFSYSKINCMLKNIPDDKKLNFDKTIL